MRKLTNRKNILIVCEGEHTETNYFASIRDFLIDQKVAINIKIIPTPKIDKEKDFLLRVGAKKRELKKLDAAKEDELAKAQIEEEFRSQPVNYVRIAQKGLEDGVFDEAWAVYDLDQHPNQKAAYELSLNLVNGKRVNIAYTGIAFEHWILLHFEFNDTAFTKSQCRINREVFDCGHNRHASDCRGNLCVCGYLVTKGYFRESLIRKEFHFSELPDYRFAISNAIELKRIMEERASDLPFYEINPYTTIHRLIYRLLVFPLKEIVWFNCNEHISTNEIAFNLSVDHGVIFIQIRNLRNQLYIIQAADFAAVDIDGNEVSLIERTVLNPNEERTFLINPTENNLSFPLFVGYKMSTSECMLTDL